MTIDKPILEFLPDEKTNLGPPLKLGIPCVSDGVPYMGLYLLVIPKKPPGEETTFNQYLVYEYTGQPGIASNIYYAVCFQMPKWDYKLVKVDEWIEVSPTHREYYERVQTAKGQLEGQIKQGLASAASAVADYELVQHDLRKYKEIMNYLSREDEHPLRAMFIDQVDIHTGNMAMVQTVQRWSTLIADFQKMNDEDIDVDKIAKRLNISKAEAVILKTKNLLYIEWRKMFKDASIERYERLVKLVEGRKKSIEEYQEWVKPYLIRYKTMRFKHERPGLGGSTLQSYADITGQSFFENKIRLWAWKPFKVSEPHKPTLEKTGDFVIDPYDDYVRQSFILNAKTGLAKIFPWILTPRAPPKDFEIKKNGEAYYEKYKFEADALVEQIKSDWREKKDFLDPSELYYLFVDFDITRLGLRTTAGELENIKFFVRNNVISQNILLVKLLELKCREMELGKYVDEILGVKKVGEEAKVEDIVKKDYPKLFGIKPPKEKNGLEQFAEEWKAMRMGIENYAGGIKNMFFKFQPYFVKYGPYERVFKERITKQMLSHSGSYFKSIKSLISSKMGVN